MRLKSLAELPKEHTCRKCGATKPIDEMVLIRNKRTHDFLLRSRCKACQNEHERGHRREWKTKYLRRWRRWNSELNESYWRQRSRDKRPELNARAMTRFLQNHDAILIQGRLRRTAGMHVTLAEATELCRKYGRCYPHRAGLTPKGLREAERIRSRSRLRGKPLRAVEARMMVYEDGENFVIKPRLQKLPHHYRVAASRLHRWQVRRGSPNALVLGRKVA
jgi:hypothetical protein